MTSSRACKSCCLGVLALFCALGCAHQLTTCEKPSPALKASNEPFSGQPELRRAYLEGYIAGIREAIQEAADAKGSRYNDFAVRNDSGKAWIKGYYDGNIDTIKALAPIHDRYMDMIKGLIREQEQPK